MSEPLNKVDMIIPIYNALNDLEKCLNSVLEFTNLTIHRLLLINDSSSDERILPYLELIKMQNASQNIKIINNGKNLGFSGSINCGISVSSDSDVILLNSDTIVTCNWLDKLYKCAYSNNKIGTVTPMSNNATLCSVPEFFKENCVPDGFTVQSYATLIEECSLKKYPRLPVANGYCMFIKRELIKKIGVFDSDTFGKGYGEENDFCYRAEQIGYSHVLCDDTFIYHKGTSSFVNDEKKKFTIEHEKILRKRYPAQVQKLQEFLHSCPNRIINENIKLYQILRNNRKNILYLVQADFRADADDNIGGTQLNVKDLTGCLRKRFNVYVIARNINHLNVTVYLENTEIFLQYYIGYEPLFPEFRSNILEKVYGTILDAFHIDLVHIHHVKGLSLEMYYQAHIHNIPIVTTLHDYYFACPSIKLLDNDNKTCIGKESPAKCRKCLNIQKGYSNQIDYISIWRQESKNVLNYVEQFISPSQSSKNIICRYFPEIEKKVTVIEHGNIELLPCEISHNFFQKINVAFIGGLSPEKGSDLAYEMIKNGPEYINWYAFGMMGYTALNLLQKKNFLKTGIYHRCDLPSLFQQHSVDIVCILSVWPETYCYTLTEALQCQLPVIVTDIGALGERVRKLNCGWTISIDSSASDILKLISYIKVNPDEYQEKLEAIKKIKLKTISEMGSDYESLYNIILKKHGLPLYKNYNKKYVLNGYLLANGLLSIDGDNENLYKRLQETETELLSLHRSVAYKIGLMICRIRIPFKKQLKAFLFRFYRRSLY